MLTRFDAPSLYHRRRSLSSDLQKFPSDFFGGRALSRGYAPPRSAVCVARARVRSVLPPIPQPLRISPPRDTTPLRPLRTACAAARVCMPFGRAGAAWLTKCTFCAERRRRGKGRGGKYAAAYHAAALPPRPRLFLRKTGILYHNSRQAGCAPLAAYAFGVEGWGEFSFGETPFFFFHTLSHRQKNVNPSKDEREKIDITGNIYRKKHKAQYLQAHRAGVLSAPLRYSLLLLASHQLQKFCGTNEG